MHEICRHSPFFYMCLQLYWPDDKKWYLIEVHSVNPKTRTAK